MVNIELFKKKPNRNSRTVQGSVNPTTVVPSFSFKDWKSIFLIHVTQLIIFFRFKQVDMTMKEANKFMVSLSVDISDGRKWLAAVKQQVMSTCVNINGQGWSS